jgi:signal transduction histidine kinase
VLKARAANAVFLQAARMLAEAAAPGDVVELLAGAALELSGADAAVVVKVMEDGAVRVVASRGVAKDLSGWIGEAEAIGNELGADLRAACGPELAQTHVRPMMSSGGLFGALVLLFRAAEAVDPARFELTEGLVDLAATAMSRAAQLEELRRAHADLRASQDALLRTEKLRALGQMAAGVAHDLKNILNPLSLHLQLLKRETDPKAIAETIAEMQQVLRRGVETLERMRAFSRQTPGDAFEPVDLDKLVHEAAALAKPRMASRKGGRLSKIDESYGAPPKISAMPGELVSAIVNLVVNAIDATTDGGAIHVRTREERGGACVEIADEGPGMPPDVERRVYEPFFTTKGEAGTGLGLAMVYACVERHKGTIALRTAPGEGTTFTLWFPASRPPPT